MGDGACGATRLLGGTAVACLAAIVVTTAANGVLNTSIYPLVAGYFGIAREISTMFGGVIVLCVYLVAVQRPALLDARLLLGVMSGFAVLACLVLVPAIDAENRSLTIAGLLCIDIVTVWANVVTIMALSTLEARASLVCVAFGVAVGEIAATLVPGLSAVVSVVLYAALQIVVVVALRRPSATALSAIAREDAPASLELTNPESFLRPSNPFFACTLLMGVAMGYGLTLNAVESSPAYSTVQGLALLAVAFWVVFFRQQRKEDGLFTLSVLLAAAGLILAPSSFTSDSIAANVLMRAGSKSFEMLLMLAVLSIGRRNPLALLSTFAFAQFVMGVGVDVGAVLGNVTGDLVAQGTELPTLIAQIVLFAYVAILWLSFRSFNFSEMIQGVAKAASLPAAEEGADAMATAGATEKTGADMAGTVGDAAGATGGASSALGGLDARVAALAEQHGLTTRETEVFALLARGRNGQYIMNSLVISKNTVKSHCSRIYAKLGVHSQQELIDLVEAGE